jgi:hypothetical protein
VIPLGHVRRSRLLSGVLARKAMTAIRVKVVGKRPSEESTVSVGRRHYKLYVVLLSPEVLTRPKFVAENPNYVQGRECLYVGMTGLTTVEERFENHKRGHKCNRYARDFGIRLAMELVPDRTAMTWEEAKTAESALAAKLRAEGYAVWQR